MHVIQESAPPTRIINLLLNPPAPSFIWQNQSNSPNVRHLVMIGVILGRVKGKQKHAPFANALARRCRSPWREVTRSFSD